MKGPIVTKGYHNNPEANEKAFTKDGWLRTGDIMRMDSNKLWHIVDRKKVSSQLYMRLLYSRGLNKHANFIRN